MSFLNAIKRISKFFKAIVKKNFESVSGDENDNLNIYLPFILLLADQSFILEKNSGKRYLTVFLSSGATEFVFAVLQKVIVLCVCFIIVYI